MNARIWILALIFGLAETSYFGWNLLPQSPAEMVCDGITVLLCALAMIAPRHIGQDAAKCESCAHGYDGTNGNGYQPCACKRPNV